MKKLMYVIIIAFSLVFTNNLIAEELTVNDCKYLSKLSGKIMEARQLGTPIDLVTAAVGGDQKNFDKLVYAAYEVPEYLYDSEKEEAVRIFKEEVLVRCLRLMASDM